jgi:hypothetical protein
MEQIVEWLQTINAPTWMIVIAVAIVYIYRNEITRFIKPTDDIKDLKAIEQLKERAERLGNEPLKKSICDVCKCFFCEH